MTLAKESVWSPRYYNVIARPIGSTTLTVTELGTKPKMPFAYETPEHKLAAAKAREEASIAARAATHLATAKDYQDTKDYYSNKMSTADIDACLAKVTNPFDRAQVDAMKACFVEKLKATEAATAAWEAQQSGGGGSAAPDSPEEPQLSIQKAAMPNWQVVAVGSVILVLGYLGYKYWKTKQSKV